MKLVAPNWAPETNVSHKEFGSAVCVSASHNFDRKGENVRTRTRLSMVENHEAQPFDSKASVE